jgi:hypothetical protein
MTIGALLDGKHRPSKKDIQASLGASNDLWDDLVKSISTDHGVRGDLEFGGAKYGWALEFRKGGRALVSMFPAEGYFTVQIVLGKAAVPLADALDLGKNARWVFDNARQLYDGRWLYMPVRTKRDLEDAKLLIAAKVESKKARP